MIDFQNHHQPSTPPSNKNQQYLSNSLPQPSGIFEHSPYFETPKVFKNLSPDLNFSPNFNLLPDSSPGLYLKPQDNLHWCFNCSQLVEQSHNCYNFEFPTSSFSQCQNCYQFTNQSHVCNPSTDNQFDFLSNFLNLNPNPQISNLLTRISNIQKTVDQYSQRTNSSSSYSKYISTLTELQNQFKSQLQLCLKLHIQDCNLSSTSQNIIQLQLDSQKTSHGLCSSQKTHNIPPTSDSLSDDILNLQQRLFDINLKQSQSKNKLNIVQSALQQQLEFLILLQHNQKQ